MSRSARIITELAESIAIPESAYETVKRRYEDVGEWLRRPGCSTLKHSPHVYPQGSFRLGTVVRPVDPDDEFDLDLGCRLREGISKQTHTQESLKDLVGLELKAYRHARQIKEPLEAKHRCWRLRYRDELGFHMDVVPSIPEDALRRQDLSVRIAEGGLDDEIAGVISDLTGAITDDRHVSFTSITGDWRISNSEGYALWFEARMKLASELLEKRAARAQVGRIDQLPAYRWHSPLQTAVQILKRHRDVMYLHDTERQPISIIITTLAGHAYDGADELDTALVEILRNMDKHIRPHVPRIPNPVNPAEDFADKWHDPRYARFRLEDEFHRWLARARQDFDLLLSHREPKSLVEFARKKYSAVLDGSKLDLGASGLAAGATALGFPPKAIAPTKPAGFA